MGFAVVRFPSLVKALRRSFRRVQRVASTERSCGSSSRTRKIRTPSDDFALPRGVMRKWVAQRSFCHRRHRFCSNCGANNTSSVMSKPH
jgi:hypothetical protein